MKNSTKRRHHYDLISLSKLAIERAKVTRKKRVSRNLENGFAKLSENRGIPRIDLTKSIKFHRLRM